MKRSGEGRKEREEEVRRAEKEEVHLQRGGGLNGGKGTGRIGGLKKEMRRITHETELIGGRKGATQVPSIHSP